ncbi:MAG: YcaO-like family protein [Oligoflexus sp.]
MMQPLKFQIDPLKGLQDWQITEPFQQKVKIEGLQLYICGLQAIHPVYGEVVGSGANLGDFPQNQAWYELLERIATVESFQRKSFPYLDPTSGKKLGKLSLDKVFPQPGKPIQKADFQYAKSNGIALHTNWSEACLRACCELVERHLVLASWLGYVMPIEMKPPLDMSPLQQLADIYEVKRIGFGWQRIDSFSEAIFTSGVILLPYDLTAPLIMGFGAGMSQQDSLVKAEAEALQRLGFLWGEELPSCEPAFHPTPLFHQEYYLFPGNRRKIENWLAGKHRSFCQNDRSFPQVLQLKFVDLTSADLQNFKVVKAISPQSIPLVFGKWRQGEFGSIPEDLIIHPIA